MTQEHFEYIYRNTMDIIAEPIRYFFLKNRLINIFMSGFAFAFSQTYSILSNNHALPVILKQVEQDYIPNKYTYDD